MLEWGHGLALEEFQPEKWLAQIWDLMEINQ